jgi:hypothetical protein
MWSRITAAWIKTYIIYPMAPVLIDALLRYVVKQPTPIWKTMSASNVALTMGILALFVSQSIYSKKTQLEDDEVRHQRISMSADLNTCGIFSFVFFGVISFFEMISDKHAEIFNQMPVGYLYLAVGIVSIYVLYKSLRAQMTYKLAVSE